MTEDEQIQKIEKERRQREAALLILLLLLSEKARQLVGASIRMGVDPTLPIRQVIMGDANLHLPGLPGMLAAAMADSHLAGMRQVYRLADEPLPMELVGHDPTEIPLYTGTGRYYMPSAFDAAQKLQQAMSNVVLTAMQDAARAQMRTAGMARFALRSLTRYGFSRYDPQSVNPDSKGSAGYALEAMASESVLTGFNDGMWGGYTSPPINARLTAFTHHSILDERTSDICIDRDTLTLPPDDPYWLRGWPKLHNRCRSLVLAHFRKVEMSKWRPTVPVQAGFGIAPALAYGVPVGRAA